VIVQAGAEDVLVDLGAVADRGRSGSPQDRVGARRISEIDIEISVFKVQLLPSTPAGKVNGVSTPPPTVHPLRGFEISAATGPSPISVVILVLTLPWA
jgi:hypothetical protein